MSSQTPGFGVYVHWPFCETICPYCDFNVHQSKTIDEDAWRDALISEISHYAAETIGRTVTSIYFGGGTPSLMQPDTIAAIINSVPKHWSVADNLEITLEINPTSSERKRLRDFHQAGINRLSIGIQSLNNDALTFLGRNHTQRSALQALEDAAHVFPRTTFDLMYALPMQTLEGWYNELTDALTYAQGHISLYQLTIESGTPFARQGLEACDENLAADMFELTQRVMSDAGHPAYEISNHAQPGDESRHNLTCWRGGDYLGVGPGAHGRLSLDGGIFGTHQIHNPKRWLEKAQADGHGTAKRRHISRDDRARELVMMGLRLHEGIDPVRFQNIAGKSLPDVIDQQAVEVLVDNGLIDINPQTLKATSDGRQRLNAVIAKLLN